MGISQERNPPDGEAGKPGWLRSLAKRIWQTYYALKYLAFHANRPRRVVPDEQRGYVCIHIDGLAYDHLLLAMDWGYMRHLRRWLRRGFFELRHFLPGVPTTTSYAQAGILFGTEKDIPAFRWYERQHRRVVNCNEPSSVQFMRDKIVGDRPGALEGGSSYANLLDGGAERIVFTVAGTHDDSIVGRMGGKHLLLLVLLHPIRIVRTLVAGALELFAEFYDRWLNPDPRADHVVLEGLFPLLRVGSNVLLRELQTFGLLVDIHVGVPYIYTSFYGYDEVAHHFGPTSKAAFTTLRHIDRRIAEILRMIRHGAARAYDLIILSDHGQTPAIPFERQFGRTLGEDIAAQLREQPVHVSRGPDDRLERRAQYLTRKVQAGRLARLPGVIPAVRAIEKRVLRRPLEALLRPETVYADAEVGAVVTYSSCLAHLYLLADSPARMDYDRIVHQYPGFVEYLRRHKGIGPFFVRKDAATWYVMDGKNTAELCEKGLKNLHGADPLRSVDRRHTLLPELWQFLNFSNVGDIILFGRYDGERVICFDDQVGAHGSLGGEQMRPFIMLPEGHPACSETLRGYAAIYRKVLMPYRAARQGE